MRYRHHPLDFKRAVVEASLQPGVSVARLAREQGVNANQIFAWRKAYREGHLAGPALLPVTVVPEGAAGVAQAVPAAPVPGAGRVVLERDGTRVVIEGRPDVAVLERILAGVLG